LLLIPSRFYLKRFWISCCDLILFEKLQPVSLKISILIFKIDNLIDKDFELIGSDSCLI